jgi:hypothetical protein
MNFKLTVTNATPLTPGQIEEYERLRAELPNPKTSPVDLADSRYNRSEKGRERQARYREANRARRQAYDRERMSRLRGNLYFRQREDEYYRLVRRPRELLA